MSARQQRERAAIVALLKALSQDAGDGARYYDWIERITGTREFAPETTVSLDRALRAAFPLRRPRG